VPNTAGPQWTIKRVKKHAPSSGTDRDDYPAVTFYLKRENEKALSTVEFAAGANLRKTTARARAAPSPVS
jgi:hypothetical protein